MVQIVGDPEVIHRGMMRSVLDDVTAADIALGMDELRGLADDRDGKWADFQACMSHVNQVAGVPGNDLSDVDVGAVTAMPDPDLHTYADRGWMRRGVPHTPT